MLYTIPDYYHEFTCVAGKCEDTCCAGWQIVADEASLENYKNETDTFAERLKESVNWEEGTFKQDKERRCAFLNQSNLCDMYTALGEESLCRTCKLYPRHIEEFEDVREVTLSVSCPEVARILMNKKEPVHFLTYETDEEEDYEDFDPFLYSKLLDARDVMIEILQDREKKLNLQLLFWRLHVICRNVLTKKIYSRWMMYLITIRLKKACGKCKMLLQKWITIHIVERCFKISIRWNI